MLTSVRWLNDYLDPPASAEEQAELLTRAGFPLEGTEEVEVSDGTDVRQDFEMTSNRGDCVCHLGLAREIAAISGRSLKTPAAAPATSNVPASDLVTVTNREPERCPLYTARVIRGVTIGPSPAWLADRLRARGDIPRNNVVDATNFVLFEFGQPTHTFDLATLAGAEIIVRMATDREAFLPIGEGAAEVTLTGDDLVIADAERAVAIAGVKGGALTAVTDTTTDILLEAASFSPVSVRTASRRHGIASESSYRFERGVHPGQVDAAADRLAALILELAGGELCAGVVQDGAPIPGRRTVSMRTERCRKLLGVPVPDEQMIAGLATLGFEPTSVAGDGGTRLECRVPVHRLDIEREIDLVEEVARMYGLDAIPIDETIRIRVAAPQPTELARQAVANELVGLGFIETLTHSLVGDDAAAAFLPAGAATLRVGDDRAKAEPVLQPSVLPSILRVLRHNRANGAHAVRLFESAATFHRDGDGHHERTTLGLALDVDDVDLGLRPVRGTVERLVDLLLGHGARVEVEEDDVTTWLRPDARARGRVDGRPIGVWGVLADDVARRFDLDAPVLVAELDLAGFYERYPPETEAHALPHFPAIERDLSIIVADDLRWAAIETAVQELTLDHLEACAYVTTYRGKQVPAGRKSVTFRLRFRAPDRTLTHDEVDPQVAAVVKASTATFGAEIRS